MLAGGRRRWGIAFSVIAVLALITLASTVWLYTRAEAAKAALTAAEQDIRSLKKAIGASDVDPQALARQAEAVRESTSRARDLSDDLLWRAASHVPVLGCPLGAARDLVAAADDTAQRVLPDLAAVARQIDPAALWSGSRLQLEPLKQAEAPIDTAYQALDEVRADLDAMPDCGWLSDRMGIESARTRFLSSLDQVEPDLRTARTATALLPAMLGDGGTRHYLLIVQNPAEARATGGLLGGYGVVTVSDGTIDVGEIRANSDLTPIDPPLPLEDYGEDFAERYGGFWPTYYWQNANVTPHFPTAARIWADMWRTRTGQQVDGVIATDVPALGHLLAVTGPVTLAGGEVLRADNLVKVTMSDAYARYTDNTQRDAYLARVGTAIARKVTSGAGDPIALAKALGTAATEGRLLVWSRDETQQELLETTTLGGALPDADGPFLGVVVQNGSASKLEYYLAREVDYAYRQRKEGGGEATVTLTLRNKAPVAGLPDYVTANSEWARGRDQSRLYVSVFLGNGAGVTAATLDGEPLLVQSHREQGRPVVSAFVWVPNTATATLTLQIREPAHSDTLMLWEQPGVIPDQVTVSGIEAVSAR